MVAACSGPTATSSGLPATAGRQAPSGVDAALSSRGDAATARDLARLEVSLAHERTRLGAPMVAIGHPRLRVDAEAGALELRVAANRVFAVDGESVRTWRLDTGEAESRFVPGWQSYPQIALAVALDGSRIAAGSLQHVSYLEPPFTTSARSLPTHRPVQFAADGTLFLDEGWSLTAVDAQGIEVARVKAPRFGSTLAAATVGDTTFWIQDRGVLRWKRATHAIVAGTPVAKRWWHAEARDGAPYAAVVDDDDLSRLELATGTLTRLSSRAIFALCTTGARIVYARDRELHVATLADGIEVAKLTAPAPITRVACDTDTSIAYVAAGRVHVVALGTSERPYEEPARFAGWGRRGSAIVEQRGTRYAVELATATGVAVPDGPPVTPVVVDPFRTVVIPHAVTVMRGHERVAQLALASPSGDEAHVRTLLAAAVTSQGTAVAMLWFQAWLPRRPPDDRGDGPVRVTACDPNPRDGTCWYEYILEVRAMPSTGKSEPGLRVRFDSKYPSASGWTEPKVPTGALAFTHDGSTVLVGFEDGDVAIVDAASGKLATEAPHAAAVTSISASPGDDSVLSEDRAGEQRIWPLARAVGP